MIKRIITQKPVNAKRQEAMEFYKELMEYAKRKYPNGSQEVFAEKYGEAGTLYFIVRFDSIEHMEDLEATVQADGELQALWAKSRGLFIDGSLKVTLLEAL